MKKLLILFALIVVSCTLWAQNNVITYTAPSQLVGTTDFLARGLHTDAFNVAIVSHTFADGTGTITFAEDVTSIGFCAFYGCSSLISISIPNSVTSIGAAAFSDCSGLTSIEIPSSVTSIGVEAFASCTSLGSITIPSSVTGIDGNAFSDCSGLTSIVVEQGNAIYDSRNNCNAIIETASNTLISGCQNTLIPNSVTSIGDGAFKGCSNLKTMIIPEGVTSIGDNAYIECSNLTSITISNSVTSIGGSAFVGCSGLTSVTIPPGVISIERAAFARCSSLTSIVVDPGNAIYDSRDNCNAIIETANNTLVSGCKNTMFPSSVTSIGISAFSGCSDMTSIDIPNSVMSIGHDAFSGCSGLISIDIPSSVTSIGTWACHGCSRLTSVVLPSSVMSIGERTFEYCYDLKFVTIPNGVTSIGVEAFASCTSLGSITIPSSVTSIGKEAFVYCYGLFTITCLAEIPPTLEEDVFRKVPRNTLYVPASSIPLYQAAEQWREFDIQPYLIEIEPVAPNTTELTWNPVDSASLYQLHLYTDSTTTIALDTTLLINADSLNGGIMLQTGTSAPHRVRKRVEDEGGTIVVVTIDPSSGSSEENPYKVTVSTASGERVDVHFDMKVFQGTEILREESGSFVLNDVQPEAIENTLAPSLPTGIYDLYGHRYPAEAWETLPGGVYVVREDNKVEKMMKR